MKLIKAGWKNPHIKKDGSESVEQVIEEGDPRNGSDFIKFLEESVGDDHYTGGGFDSSYCHGIGGRR